MLIPFLSGFPPKGELDALRFGDILQIKLLETRMREKEKLSNIICNTIE